MPYLDPDMTEIIRRLDQRIAALERGWGKAELLPPTTQTGAQLTITGLALTTGVAINSYLYNQAWVKANWNAVTFDPADVKAPKIDGYLWSWRYTAISPASWEGEYLVDASEANLDSLPMGQNIEFRVRVKTQDNQLGPYAYATITTAQDDTAPPQPSNPTAVSRLGTLQVGWDGLTSTGGAMPGDFDHVNVYVSTTSGFTPTSATKKGEIYPGGGTTTIDGLTYGTTYYVRLTALDATGNESPYTPQSSATIVAVVATDVSGIVLPGDVAFSDTDNLVLDGSFEDADMRSMRNTALNKSSTNVAFGNTANTAKHGDWYLAITDTSSAGRYMFVIGGDANLAQQQPVSVVQGQKFYFASNIKGVSANGAANIYVRWTLQDNTTSDVLVHSVNTSTGAYIFTETIVTAPTNAKYMHVYAQTTTQTTGTWFYDALQVRKVIGTQLIEDAAITNAKIGNLAVNDAKIANLSVGKLTAGTLSVDITVSARIKTADTGARTEMNSLGIHAYDGGGTRTFFVEASTGNVTVVGRIQTGTGTAQVIVDDNLVYSRPAVYFLTGDSSQVQPSVWAASGGSGGYVSGAMMVVGRETTTNSSGRAELELRPGGDLYLHQLFGTASGTGIESPAGDTCLVIGKTNGATSTSARNQYLNSAQSVGTLSSGSGVSSSVTFGIGAPNGTRRTLVTPFGTSGWPNCVTTSQGSGTFGWQMYNSHGSVSSTGCFCQWYSIWT